MPPMEYFVKKHNEKTFRENLENMNILQMASMIIELKKENERLTEQAERQLEIINKMKFLDMFKGD